MRMRSSATTYGNVAVTIHWLSAILIVALLVSGFRSGQAVDPADKAQFLVIHVPLAVAVLALTAARIVWWWRFDDKPMPVGSDPVWQERIAGAVHVLLYIFIFGIGASGIGMIVLSGAGEILFADGTGPLPDFADYLPRVPHGLGARAMVVLLAIHAVAALYHHFVKRDALLLRMWYGGS